MILCSIKKYIYYVYQRVFLNNDASNINIRLIKPSMYLLINQVPYSIPSTSKMSYPDFGNMNIKNNVSLSLYILLLEDHK